MVKLPLCFMPVITSDFWIGSAYRSLNMNSMTTHRQFNCCKVRSPSSNGGPLMIDILGADELNVRVCITHGLTSNCELFFLQRCKWILALTQIWPLIPVFSLSSMSLLESRIWKPHHGPLHSWLDLNRDGSQNNVFIPLQEVTLQEVTLQEATKIMESKQRIKDMFHDADKVVCC